MIPMVIVKTVDSILEQELFEEKRLDRIERMKELREHHHTYEEIGRRFGITAKNAAKLVDDERHTAEERRKSPNRILRRFDIGVSNELTKEAIDYIKSRPWRSRKNIAYELYLRGYTLDETGKIVGTKSDPYKKSHRQEVNEFLKTTSYDRRLHRQRKRERKINRKIDDLCRKFNIDRIEFEETVRKHYLPGRDGLTISKLTCYPKVLISQYIKINQSHLSGPEQRLHALKTLYQESYDISTTSMISQRDTYNLYNRLVIDNGTYKNALLRAGINPRHVYRRNAMMERN